MSEMGFLIVLYILTFLYGILIGSFLNVCICRIPNKESIVVHRSHCTSCGTAIRWYDLVPLLSWLLLRGKCRTCKAKISVQYPIVELANGLLYLLIMSVCGFNMVSVLYCLASSALLALSVIDWRTFEIPIGFNVFIFVIGIIRMCLDLRHWSNYVIGFFAISGFLMILYILTKGRGIGGGDIKLMAVAGLLIGWKLIILSLMLGCILGSVIHIVLMKVQGKERMLAFGPYLSIGIYISMLFGTEIIDWYVKTFVY